MTRLTPLERCALAVVRGASRVGLAMPEAIDQVELLCPTPTRSWEVRHALERLLELGWVVLDARLALRAGARVTG